MFAYAFASFVISFEYLWMDGQKKTSKVPAPQYIDFVMSWIQTLINDENTFPTKEGMETPDTELFLTTRILSRTEITNIQFAPS